MLTALCVGLHSAAPATHSTMHAGYVTPLCARCTGKWKALDRYDGITRTYSPLLSLITR